MSEPNREKEIFGQALDVSSPEDRAAFIEGACAGDANLARRIKALIEASESDVDFLPGSVQVTESSPTQAKLSEEPGTVIDRYKLLQQIGEGGFGVVYMAEQREPVKRRVALKIIKLGMDTKQVVARFEAERQALAMMDHANIAKVLDGGSTETGRPYFVMELVKGIPITRYCDEQNLSTAERLELFIKVCTAVQHAHQKGIIHRDLKPSNILVTMHDGVPVPKVIDFGIAKATQQELTEKTLFTEFNQFIGTPAYMSPEQAERSGLDIDTRSDIYSLGVLLYELLTGKTPFGTRELLSAGLDEMRRIIREQEPVKPSTRLSTMDNAELTELARHRKSEPRKMGSVIRGDLDWVVMKSLEKDRTRRYETANGLAADLRRHLENEPVSAAAPTLIYQLSKFYRRNRKFARLAGAFGVLLLTATLFSAWMAVEATRAKREQFRLRKEAEQQHEAAETVGRLAADRAEALASQIYFKNIEDATAAIDRGDQEVARGILRDCAPGSRQWEWNYLSRTLPPRIVLPTKENPIFTRDGRLIMAGTDDRNRFVKEWDPATGRELRTLIENDADIVSLAMSLDERRFVTAQQDGMVKLWGTSGNNLWSVPAHAKRVDGLAFCPDGSSVASCGWDGMVKLWDVNDGSLLREWGPFDRELRGVVFSPDGQRIAVGKTRHGTDRDLPIWSVQTGEAVITLHDSRRAFMNVLFSPDGRWIATSATEGAVILWDASTGEPVRTMEKASPTPGLRKDGMVFSEDSARLVVADPAGVRILEVATGDLVVSMRLPDVVACYWVGLSPDNRRLAVFMRMGEGGGLSTSVWDLQHFRPEILDAHQNSVLGVAFSPDGKTVASSSSDGTTKIWNAASHELKRSISTGGGWPLAFSVDGHEVFGNEKMLGRWSLDTGEQFQSYHASDETLGTCAVSPDGRLLATGGHDNIVRIWEIAGGRLLNEFHGHETGCYTIYSVDYNPDGSLLASAACDGTLRIWAAATGRLLHTFDTGDPTLQLVSTVFSPDGSLVLAGSAGNNSIYALEVGSGKQLMRLSGGHMGSVWGLAMSPDGQRIASGGEFGIWTIWDVNTGHRLFSRNSGQGSIWSLDWSPDGRTIVTGGGDGTIKFWRGGNPTEP